MSTEEAGPGYAIVPFARIREVVIDVMIPARKKHNIHLFFEADVTDARQHLRRQKAETGESLSFTAFLIKCTAKAAMSNKRLSARRISRRRLAIFDDVHVAYTIETEVAGQSHPLSRLIPYANKRDVREIHDQLRAFTEEKTQELVGVMRRFSRLPRVVRAMAFSWFGRNPKSVIASTGTVLVTSVGMFGAGGGHVIPFMAFPLCIGVGGITRKPGMVEDRIEPREFLSVTATFDHDITDGAPAARFVQELKELIEKGYGLLDSAS